MKRLELQLKNKRKDRDDLLYQDTLCLLNRRNDRSYRQILKAYMQIYNLDINEVCHNLIKVGNYENDIRRSKNKFKNPYS